MQSDITPYIVIGVAAAAALTDVTSRRIPNVLTFGAAGAALIYGAATGSAAGAFDALAGWLVGALLLMPLFLVRGMGAGDVKLVAALGAWVGPVEALWLVVAVSLAGGVVGVGYALARGYLRQAVSNLVVIGMHWRYSGFQPVPGLTLDNAQAPRLPYAIPILIGTMVTLWLA